MESDVHFIHGIQKTVARTVESCNEPVFLYRFSFDGQIYLIPRVIEIPFKGMKLSTNCNGTKNMLLGASHADELCYLFKSKFTPEVKSGSLVETTIKRMIKFWTNFAKYSNPVPNNTKDDVLNIEWKAVAKSELNYLNIGDELNTGVNPDAERMKFWDKLYEDYPEAKYW